MKKRTIFLIALAVILMAVGGIGSVVYYRIANKTMINHIDKSYSIKDTKNLENVEFTINGNVPVSVITNYDSDDIKLDVSSTIKAPISVDWDAKESNGKTIISLNLNREPFIDDTPEIFTFGFGFWDEVHQPAFVYLPENMENLTINNQSKSDVEMLGEMRLNTLKATSKSGNISTSLLTADKVDFSSETGDVLMNSEITANEVSVKTDQGDIYLYTVNADKIQLESKSGDIDAYESKGGFTVQTTSGEATFENVRGTMKMTGKSGSFSLNGYEALQTLDVALESGDIDITFTDTLPKNLSVEASTEVGDINLLDSNKTSYKAGTGKQAYTLKTKLGDIDVYGYDYDDDAFEDKDEDVDVDHDLELNEDEVI